MGPLPHFPKESVYITTGIVPFASGAESDRSVPIPLAVGKKATQKSTILMLRTKTGFFFGVAIAKNVENEISFRRYPHQRTKTHSNNSIENQKIRTLVGSNKYSS